MKTGDRLPQGTEIALPARASAELTSPNGNRLALYPGSRMVLLHASDRAALLEAVRAACRPAT